MSAPIPTGEPRALPEPIRARLVVQKFGGSSLATPERVQTVAARIAACHANGHAVVVVVSAMGKTTDELVRLARTVSGDPSPRELDVLLTSGERVASAIVAMALAGLGVPSVSLTGRQSGIVTESAHGRARIVNVRPDRICEELEAGRVVVVAGFQGIAANGDVTTLGRGGSDTTAVALAQALRARSCEIFSDVDGVYTADPRICPAAQHLEHLDYETMIDLARHGARVLHVRAVERAAKAKLTIVARATVGSGRRTAVDDRAPLDAPGMHGVVAVTGRHDLLRIQVSDAEAERRVIAALGDRVPVLGARSVESTREVWAIGEELPDPEVFAAELLRTQPCVDVVPRLGSVALVGRGVGSNEAVRELLQACLLAARIPAKGILRTEHGIAAFVDHDLVDRAVVATHAVVIEAARRRVSCAS